MINLTENAKEHLKSLLTEQSKKFVRLAVKGGGCAGFEYQWTFEDEQEEEDELVEDILLIDEICEPYLKGLTVDFKKEIWGSGFEFDNPTSKSSCGCGTSFAV